MEGNIVHPLQRQREKLKVLDNYIGPLLDEFYTALKIVRPKSIEIDFELLDEGIERYGYERAYEDLFLHIIVYAGECWRSAFGGRWIVEESDNGDLFPFLIDGDNIKHSFDLEFTSDGLRVNIVSEEPEMK